MKFGKRQLILAALVVALGAAVYINWQFTDNKSLVATNAASSTKELGQATYVDANVSQEETPAQPTNTSEQPHPQATSETPSQDSAQNSSSSDYFAQAALSRQQTKDSSTDALKEVVESPKSTDEAKVKATEEMAQMAKNTEIECNIENLIRAKGYQNCVVFIQNGECSVVASAPQGLLESDTIVIKDIVCGQSGINYDKIKIIQVKE
ncbi:MAG: SpoIIIAH-like family protein [Clostridia bacterium]|nr:SpoIIIAH-like family protein [Clostridia bacterium]